MLVWEVARPAFARIQSHDYSSCRQFLAHSIGIQVISTTCVYMCVLFQPVGKEICTRCVASTDDYIFI